MSEWRQRTGLYIIPSIPFVKRQARAALVAHVPSHRRSGPMNTIFRNSPVPRYHQLKEILRERVRSGEWQPGDLIPSERELSESYSISRMTARQAITDLVNEGVFYREQGKGTFVSRNKITQQLMRLTGFTEDMSARGQHPSTQVLSAQVCPADEQVAEHLRVP